MRQNPFSLYDFLGYVFPGAFTLILISFFANLGDIHSLSDLYVGVGDFIGRPDSKEMTNSQNTTRTLFFLEETIIWTIVAYIVGHIVAYLSSLTVEKFAIWTYDYPSKFLFSEVPSMHYWNVTGDQDNLEPTNWRQFVELVWRLIIGIFLFPISLCTILFGKLLCLKYFFVKQLDNTLKDAINSNMEKLADSLDINKQNDDDFHRIVYHYEYERQSTHVQKMDNYVALYGFLRAMSFIFNCSTVWIVYKYVIPTISLNFKIDWHLVLMIISCITITYIFFMAFMKFYRRFTLESLMCLVIDSSFKETKTIPYDYTSLHATQIPTWAVSSGDIQNS